MPLLVTAAIIYRSGKILITRRPPGSRHAGQWEFPGGKLLPGEDPEFGLQREIREELDLPIDVEEIFEVVYHRYDWGPVLILSYLASPLSTTIRNLEVAEHRWVLPAELDDFPILSADQPIIRKLQKHVFRD